VHVDARSETPELQSNSSGCRITPITSNRGGLQPARNRPPTPRRYFREAESYWRGGFGAVTETQTYGEVCDNSPGGSPIPTMNGRVSHYRTNTGSRLTRYTLSSPYRITNARGTGFTFSS
jgi:hypothetical protein